MGRLRRDEIRVDEPYATILRNIVETRVYPETIPPAVKAQITKIMNKHSIITEKKVIVKVNAKPVEKTSRYTIFRIFSCLFLFSLLTSLTSYVVYLAFVLGALTQ